jgi:hypothetical protein
MPPEQRKNFDSFRSQSPAEETFRSVLLGVLNEFLDGDLEVVRNFLSGYLSPSPVVSKFLMSHGRGNNQIQFIAAAR